MVGLAEPELVWWHDAQRSANGDGSQMIFQRLQMAMAGIQSMMLGTGCLTPEGQRYLGLGTSHRFIVRKDPRRHVAPWKLSG